MNMQKTILVLIFISFYSLAIDFVAGLEIENPQLMESMKAEVLQKGNITLQGNVHDLELFLYIPQDDDFQKIESISMSNEKYEYTQDKFGNKILKLVWETPPSFVEFWIKSVVTVKRRSLDANYNSTEFLKPSELVNSQDKEVKELAENIILGKKTDFERISSLMKWVYENLQYDKNYADVNLSAKKVLELRRGVCDEFSTLLISFARSDTILHIQ